eukprot:gb/GFBE01078049.1/.p1 GENE.gb/GFBE01078049.1/~~gb/GFBE01078049.1/.p1  ORF type:complete len:251 (+),score=72.26 gb/GFBE01078049.1/:1-753(+)
MQRWGSGLRRRSRQGSTLVAASAVLLALVLSALRPQAFAAHGFVGCHAAAASGRSSRSRRQAVSNESDEFKAARERIRRIQLGLGPNDPLPEDGEAPEPSAPASAEGDVAAAASLDLAEAGQPVEPVQAKVTDEVSTSDAKAEDKDEEDEAPVQDAFAGTAKDNPEFQASKPYMPKAKKESPNIFVALYQDLQVVTLPTVEQVAQTFGIVVLLVAAYTAFVAIVDYGSQQVLGQVFSEFYQAARPEAPAM